MKWIRSLWVLDPIGKITDSFKAFVCLFVFLIKIFWIQQLFFLHSMTFTFLGLKDNCHRRKIKLITINLMFILLFLFMEWSRNVTDFFFFSSLAVYSVWRNTILSWSGWREKNTSWWWVLDFLNRYSSRWNWGTFIHRIGVAVPLFNLTWWCWPPVWLQT